MFNFSGWLSSENVAFRFVCDACVCLCVRHSINVVFFLCCVCVCVSDGSRTDSVASGAAAGGGEDECRCAADPGENLQPEDAGR